MVITREHVAGRARRGVHPARRRARPAGLIRLTQARDLFARVALAEDYLDFLTVPAYEEYVE